LTRTPVANSPLAALGEAAALQQPDRTPRYGKLDAALQRAARALNIGAPSPRPACDRCCENVGIRGGAFPRSGTARLKRAAYAASLISATIDR